MYYAALDPESLLQGDIFAGHYFIIPPTNHPQLIQGQDILSGEDNMSFVKVRAFYSKFIVISQTCDLQRREFVSICPVYPMSKQVSILENKGLNSKDKKKYLEMLEEQRNNHFMHLPANEATETIPAFEASYIDFQTINSIPRSLLKQNERIIGLSDRGRHWLGHKLSVLFGRPFND